MIDPVTLAVINGRLEQISGWLSQEPGQQASHEWIYQYVYADKRRGGRPPYPPALPEVAQETLRE